MKTKQLINLGLILTVISALVVFKQIQKPRELATQEFISLDLSFDSSKVESLEILKPEGKQEQYVEIQKSGQGWKLKSLAGARADQSKIEELFKELKGVKGELRARDKNLFKDFEIADEEAVQIVVKDAQKKPLMDIKIGLKKAERNLFVRKSGTDQIFMTPADLFSKLGIYGDPKTDKVDNNFWASTNLLSFTSDKVESIEIRHLKEGKAELHSGVVRRSSAKDAAKKEWFFIQEGIPFQADGGKATAFIDSFSSWRASSVIQPDKDRDLGFGKSTWEIEFKIDGGKSVLIQAGDTNQETKMTHMQVTGEPVVFELSSYFLENMDADNTRFFSDNPLQIDANKISKMVVNADKQKWELHPKEKVWDDFAKYLDDLKSIVFTRTITSSEEHKKVKSPSRYFIEIQREGEISPTTFDFGDLMKDNPQEAGVRLRGNNYAFAFSEETYKKIFTETSRLVAPKETENSKQKPETSTKTDKK